MHIYIYIYTHTYIYIYIYITPTAGQRGARRFDSAGASDLRTRPLYYIINIRIS